MRSPKPSLRRFVSRCDLDMAAAATNRRALTGPRLVQHINRIADQEHQAKAADRKAFAAFQLQEPAP